MVYISDLDPQWEDPQQSEPMTCTHCGQTGTMEDFTPVASGMHAEEHGWLCPWCETVTWDGDVAESVIWPRYEP